MRLFFFCAVSLLFAESKTTSSELALPDSELGLTLGWNSPTGFGFEYGKYLDEKWQMSAGTGVGLAGFKFAFGTKYFFVPPKKFGAFIGTSIYTTSGNDDYKVHSKQENGEEIVSIYAIDPAGVLQFRGGIRIGGQAGGFYIIVGNGIVLWGGDSHHTSGPKELSNDISTYLVSPGGLELTLQYGWNL